MASVGISVEDEILSFSILTKLYHDLHSLIKKVTLNGETQGNPDAILKVLHEAALKEEALSIHSVKPLALTEESFSSKSSTTAITENVILLLPHMVQKNVGSYILN
ncbi:hypothetical protein O181_113599 [Austropuccinia psidii MF-1]|uniref:Uncharacterized protein n=1 Tax=Austropuccinia psidii MF-1 TaxID=1389203 RepID=A0A9Q3K3U8_9BASI|nr:hypothetical protein [Austropuccinia psidii MF-1]